MDIKKVQLIRKTSGIRSGYWILTDTLDLTDDTDTDTFSQGIEYSIPDADTQKNSGYQMLDTDYRYRYQSRD